MDLRQGGSQTGWISVKRSRYGQKPFYQFKYQ